LKEISAGGWEVVVLKGASLYSRIADPQRVIEPELDMDRFQRKQLSTIGILFELMRKLIPTGQWAVRSPMRSIAREIEEVWPSSEL
jgi:hypothetical protein